MDEGVEEDPSLQSPLGSSSSCGSTFETFETSALTDPSAVNEDDSTTCRTLKGRQQQLGLPALFHEGRRASDGLVCSLGCDAVVPLSETHREHKALCIQYSAMKAKEATSSCARKSVRRQVSYQLAQQQDVLPPMGADSSAMEVHHRSTFQAIAEDVEQSEWCGLPSSLAACDLNWGVSNSYWLLIPGFYKNWIKQWNSWSLCSILIYLKCNPFGLSRNLLDWKIVTYDIEIDRWYIISRILL